MLITNASFISTASVTGINCDKYVCKFSFNVLDAVITFFSLSYANTYSPTANGFVPNTPESLPIDESCVVNTLAIVPYVAGSDNALTE